MGVNKGQPGLLQLLPIETPRLKIREFRLIDARALYELHRDARATRYAGGTRTEGQSLQSLRRIIDRTRQTGFGTFAVELTETNSVIGWVGIQLMGDESTYELIYALTPTVWRRGIATEASSRLTEVAFQLDYPQISELFGIVYPQNIGSIRVLEKIGMTFQRYYLDERTQRHACLYRVGRHEFKNQRDPPAPGSLS
jgi:ribosomal-protein-alanine N-acetyltransferase